MTTQLEPPAVAPAGALNEAGWRELGKRIAAQMATGCGAEWKAHSWDDVWEARAGKWPEVDARREEIFALDRSDAEGDYDRGRKYWDAFHDAWRDELARLLREKRGSYGVAPGTAQPTEYVRANLLLADGTTISGLLHRDYTRFSFPISRHGGERTLTVEAGTEFMREPSAKRAGLRTAQLVLEHEGGGYRHYLGRRDVHCGHGITLALPDGETIGGRYECSLTRDDCEPTFYFALAGGTQGVVRCFRMPCTAEYVLEGRAL